MIRILAVILMVVMAGPAKAGLDEVYQKRAGQSWGELAQSVLGLRGFGRSYALVIGISDYDGYVDLPTGNDAERMADYLIREAGFDYVHLLTEEKVTKDRISELMSDEFPALLQGDDRFLFYWSGHGDTRSVAEGDGKAGYLPLADTPLRKWSRMIAMADVSRWQKFLSARQSLFLLDACFSGLAGFVPQSKTPRDWRIEQLSQPSYHVMSAGTENEKTIASDAWGGSLFTAAVLDGLRGAADARSGFAKDGIVSLTELKAYVQERVLFERQSAGWPDQITPQVRDLRLNAGEFFFLSNQEADEARVDPKTSSSSTEIASQSGQFAALTATPEEHESSLGLNGRAVQRSLAALGHTPGTADGILGPRTREALRSWQSANGHASTGYLTAEQFYALLSQAKPESTTSSLEYDTILLQAAYSNSEPDPTPRAIALRERASCGYGFEEVALLVPLSGPATPLGRSMYDAATMALADAGENDLCIRPFDTKGTVAGAIEAASAALEGDVSLIIGPLLTEAALRIGQLAQREDIRVLSFSNSEAVVPDGTFLSGVSIKQQFVRIVAYARRSGLNRIAVLVPENAYGEAVVRATKSTTNDEDIVVLYPARGDPSAVVGRFAKEIGNEFDAILIADGGQRLRNVVNLLEANSVDLDDVRLLGTMRWLDDLETLREPALHGAWIASISAEAIKTFVSRFQSLFVRLPVNPDITAAAYDMTALAVIVRRDLLDQSFSVASIIDSEGFAGARGLFRLRDNGTSEHGLAVLQIDDGALRELDPPPIRFTDSESSGG